MPLQDAASSAAAQLPEWWPEAVLWLGLALLVAGVAAAVGAWAIVRRLAELRAGLRHLENLQELQRTLERLLAQRDDLDLRRIEHLLIDLRDAAKRAEELILRGEERRAVAADDVLVPVGVPGLGERIVNRLVALGYERIELVTPSAEIEALAHGSGDVVVEARRDGVLCKGRVRVRAGRIDLVQLQSAFSIFP